MLEEGAVAPSSRPRGTPAAPTYERVLDDPRIGEALLEGGRSPSSESAQPSCASPAGGRKHFRTKLTPRSLSAKTFTVPPSVGSALAQANGVHRKLSSVEAIAASALLFVLVLPL